MVGWLADSVRSNFKPFQSTVKFENPLFASYVKDPLVGLSPNKGLKEMSYVVPAKTRNATSVCSVPVGVITPDKPVPRIVTPEPTLPEIGASSRRD